MNWLPWRRAAEPTPPPPRIEPTIRVPAKISPSALARAQSKPEDKINPFALPKYMPGVLPEGTKLAMDEAPLNQVDAAFNFAAGYYAGGHGLFAEGIGFFGYPYLAELSQRPEYRTPSEILAEEMTRKWVTLKATGKTDKSKKITELTADMVKFRLRDVFRDATMLDGLMGIGMIHVDLGTWEDAAEMQTRLLLDKAKIAKDSLKGFTAIDPIWIAPTNYNSRNPLDPTFYRPQIWFIMGMRVHVSRLLTIIGRPVPDLLKPAYNFGGMSLSQMLRPYVENWLRTRQSVSDLVSAFTSWVLKTNLMSSLAPMGIGGDGGVSADARLAFFTATLNNRGLMAIDKETEEFANVAVPLGTLDALQAQSQEHMAAVARIPLIKMFGITPTGLNASTDGEVRSFYDMIHAYQEKVYGAPLKIALEVLQLNRYGEIDPEITYEFNPLWELDEAGRSAVQKTQADTAAVWMQEGVIAPEESRKALAADPASPYHGLEGPAPELPDPGGEEDLSDPSERVVNKGEEGSESGANSGV